MEELPPDGRALVLHKHHQVKNTCRSWYFRIATAKLLFREIAFDTSNVSTVESAQVCLRLLGKVSKIQVRVFIAGSRGDMDKFTRLRSKITQLLKHLSRFSPNIVRRQVWDPSDRMCDLLKGRASALEYLSIGVTGSTSVFTGPLPSLRAMSITTSSNKLWLTSPLPVLSNLDLAYIGGTIGASLSGLIDLLKNLPKLQDLHLNGFRNWTPGTRFLPSEGLASTTLRNLRFTDSDFPPVLEYLHAPNLRCFIIHGTHPSKDATPLRFFRDPALLSHVQTAPILGNRALCSISAIAR